jgi:small subunit ribosomal protein S6
MRKYELTVIVDASLTDQEAGEVFEKTAKLINEFGGEVKFEHLWGRRKLAYEIDKKHHGIYKLYFVEAPATFTSGLSKQFGYDDKVLKYMALTVDDLEVSYTSFKNLIENPSQTEELYQSSMEGA